MNVEAQLVLDSFKLRPYQAPIQDALKNGKRRIIAILPRRAGKDLACWNILIREAWKKPGIYWMIYPTYSMARKILWDGLTNDGKSFLSFIPKEFVKQIYQQEMKVRLINESVIQLQGSDSPDRLVGANCYGAVFSEYALQDPIVYQQIVRPMLTANDGFAIFISTPRGKANHLWELWNIAQANPEHWFSYLMTILQTGHISVSEIQRLIDSGEMEESLAKQEFYCFPADQNVLLVDSVKSIADIKKNDLVITHTGRPRKVIDTIERFYNGELIEIDTYGSFEKIRCTPEHPIRIFSPSEQKYKWKTAKDITLQDRLVFPKKQLGDYKLISYELCMLIAWYICEGSAAKNAVQFTLGKQEEIDRVKYLLNSLNINFEIFEGTATNIVANSHELVDFFKKNCGLIATNKKIPFDLISGYENDFFFELMKGDGCYVEFENSSKYLFATVSKVLAYQVQLLAHSFNHGFAAGILYRKPYESTIDGRTIYGKESYHINIYKTEQKKGQQNKYLLRAKHSIASQIRSINRINFKGKVYNLKVQFEESYLIGGRAVHNCDFSRGVEGSFYGAYLDKARLQGRIGHVPHEPGLLVYTAFDIGVRDATTLIWYQVASQTVRILGCYSNHSVGLDHYVEILDQEQKKWGYKYGKHFAPHDIKVREWGAGAITRYEQARQLGITFTLLEQIGLSEGINNVWMNFGKLYFDEVNCKTLIDALENYRREWDEQKKVHSNKPLHNWASNYSDSLRYLVQSLPLCNFRSTTPQDLENRFKQAKYGGMNEPSFKSERY